MTITKSGLFKSTTVREYEDKQTKQIKPFYVHKVYMVEEDEIVEIGMDKPVNYKRDEKVNINISLNFGTKKFFSKFAS